MTCINQKWVTDITYVPNVKDGWVYLSTILDLHSRKIIAWDLGKTMETSLVKATLKKAVSTNQMKKGLIIHSDLGSQYTSTAYEKNYAIKELNTPTVKKADHMIMRVLSLFTQC